MRFLHAADLHLDSPMRGLERYEGAPVAELRGATRRALENLVELAIQESVGFVLLAGDLYDGDWKDYHTGIFFSRQMGRLREAEIPVFLISGNHDAASQITKKLHLPENVYIFSTKRPESRMLEHLGVAIHGQGFATRAVTEDLTRAYPLAEPHLFNIGLLHTSLDGRPGHEPYAPTTLENLQMRGYQYWALGHVHQFEIVAREPWVVYPGNMQGRHIREPGAKGCVLVSIEAEQVTGLEQRELDVMRWMICPVDLTDSMTLGEIDDRVEFALQKILTQAAGMPMIVRIQLTGANQLYSRLQANLDPVIQSCRALANDLAPDGLWIEQVQLIKNHLLKEDADSLHMFSERPDALGALWQVFHGLQQDPQPLQVLATELRALEAKLPVELRSGADPLEFTDQTSLSKYLDSALAVLQQQLLARGEK